MINGRRRLRGIFLAAVASLVMVSNGAYSAGETFDRTWLESVRREAAAQGVSQKTINLLLSDVAPLEIVAHERKNQAEFRKDVTLDKYLKSRVNPATITKGAQMIRDNKNTLDAVEGEYRVPAPLMMAIWSMETAYGQNTGDTKVIPALLTLARDNAAFRSEVIAALKLYDEGYTEIDTEPGSRAGAFGQTQFMPATFHVLGVDGDGDGRIDIWNNLSDVFASTANHLIKNGWRPGERWGREVTAPEGFNCKLLTDRKKDRQVPGMEKTLQKWAGLGIRLPGGGALPLDHDKPVALIAPNYNPKTDTACDGPYYVTYDNFWAVLQYNSSYKYVLAVNKLADAIAREIKPE